jgi:Helix-turn-helix domain
MTDETKTLATELDRLLADAAQIADRLRRLGRAGDAMDVLRVPMLLTAAQAADVCGVSDQAIYDWIKDAARMRRPFAEKRAGVWIIHTASFLAHVEKHRGGLPARVEAQNRLKKYWRSEPLELRQHAMEREKGDGAADHASISRTPF